MIPDYASTSTALGECLDLVDISLQLQTATDYSDFVVQGLTSLFDCQTTEGRAAALAELDTLFAANDAAARYRQILEERLSHSWSGEVEILETGEKHDRFLFQTIECVKWNAVIVSPWITRQGVTRFPLAEAIARATARGASVDIFTDVEFNRERRSSTYGDLVMDGSLEELTRAGATVHFVRGVHAKLVIGDDATICIGSFNWLSAARSGKYHHHELSLVHRDKGFVVLEKKKRLAELAEKEEKLYVAE